MTTNPIYRLDSVVMDLEEEGYSKEEIFDALLEYTEIFDDLLNR